jgi:hypothetical protein
LPGIVQSFFNIAPPPALTQTACALANED